MRSGRWVKLAFLGAALAVVIPSFIVGARGDDPPKSATKNPPAGSAGLPTVATTPKKKPNVAPTFSAKEKPAAPVKPKPEPRCATATSKTEPPPEDWEQSWQTQPGQNDPITVKICVDDATPAVGQKVTVTLVADDPDAVVGDNPCGWEITWGDEQVINRNFCRDFLIHSDEPRPVPPEESGHVEGVQIHTYKAKGSFTIRGFAWSGEYEGYDPPYSSTATAQLMVRVG